MVSTERRRTEPRTWQDITARVITEVLAPSVLMVILFLVIGVALGGGFPTGFWWGLAGAFFASIGPTAIIMGGVLRGRFSDHHLTVREHRRVPLIAAFALVIVGLGACGTPINKKLSMSRPCATLGADPLRRRGGQPVRRYNPILLAVANPATRDAETWSPTETIGRPIGEATARPDRPVPSTCVNAHNARGGEGCVPTWLETPGECRAPVSRAAPSGAIPSERSLGRDVVFLAALHAPRDILATEAAMLAGLVVSTPITQVWKISFHVGVAAAVGFILTITLGPVLILTYPLLAAIAWARVHLGDHTVAQVLTAVPIGALSAGLTFVLVR